MPVGCLSVLKEPVPCRGSRLAPSDWRTPVGCLSVLKEPVPCRGSRLAPSDWRTPVGCLSVLKEPVPCRGSRLAPSDWRTPVGCLSVLKEPVQCRGSRLAPSDWRTPVGCLSVLKEPVPCRGSRLAPSDWRTPVGCLSVLKEPVERGGRRFRWSAQCESYFVVPCYCRLCLLAILRHINSPILVVELNLNRLEGTQLRALGLLSVFGFNMTYAVRGPKEPNGPTSCSAIECRLLGHCYAKHDYKEFFCACFEGYSGSDCGAGPLCPRTNMCKNGGTCRQMGPAAVSCLCAAGYTGDFCESQIAAPECGIEECSEGCKDGRNCDCNPRENDYTAARFETRLQIVDQADTDISQEIVKQITSYLRASNITLEDDVEILNISSPESNGARTVWLRVWGARRDAGALRAALARLAAMRTRTDRLRLLPATLHFDMQPALNLHSLIINQRPEVWEGSEFILSCMAHGSPDIAFAWYKDGVKVNFNGTTRDIWTQTVAEDALGRRMSVLGIAEAKKPDGGRWACSANDAGRKRCRALKLAVLRPPDIRLIPSALTVNKGDNVSITCLAVAGRMHGVLGFSWAREKTLLPMAPGKEVWEDLYPAGSVLKLYNVQKSAQYHCQVSSVAGTNSKGVTLWVLGPTDEACEAEPSHGLRWPKTAPGARAAAACPPGHSGETTRFCEPKTGQHEVKWRLPDFSGCVADSLKDIYEQFSRISYGYSWGNVSDVSHQYGAVLRSLPAHPGEGTLPLQHSRQMLHYLLSAAGKPRDRVESVPHLLKIYDTLLKHPDTFLDEEKVYELQNAVADAAGMRDNLEIHLHQFTVKTKPVREDNAAHFKMQATPMGTEEWLLTSVGVELVGRNGNASVVAIQYHNLGARLPSLGRSIEFNGSSSRSGREMEFLVASPQAQLAASGAGVERALPHTVTLLFTHVHNYSAVASKLACGVRTAEEPRAWSTKACEVRVPEPSHVACRCRGLGTYALFTVARSTLTDAEKDLRGVVKITVGLGGAMCLAAAALQFLGLVMGRKTRLPVLLKAATAGTHSAALLTLLECDTRQEEACPGALGWVCAACWCAGCAALCAQPLLLQAELAGRSQRAPSVGLLAGSAPLVIATAAAAGRAGGTLAARALRRAAGSDREPLLLQAELAGRSQRAPSVGLLAGSAPLVIATAAAAGRAGGTLAAGALRRAAGSDREPLLLQAELAGRSQRAPSVGLLAGSAPLVIATAAAAGRAGGTLAARALRRAAGVCTLAWLTARLWGGAPLQLGAAAQAVCAAGCALLALLCLALAVCAALRLRTITHKVPAERRNYLADRSVNGLVSLKILIT
ncbi:uncharacterized protein [Choristoneura fumiferana]|uniref:uncharacterized protein n=1 Tax=Choristoneura fumiferana TaxID=7141 RepID=UPI003D15C687